MNLLCLTIRFMQPYSHGRDAHDDPEWPPSPLRVFQSLVGASAGRRNERQSLSHDAGALRWLESLAPPRIVAPRAAPAERPYRLYVPDNVADKVAAAWSRGREGSIAEYRTEKDVCPVRFEGEAVHYLYDLLEKRDAEVKDAIERLQVVARSITHLGWGVDMVVGDLGVISTEQASELAGEVWRPVRDSTERGGVALGVAKPGTLDDLARKHRDFLTRITADGFRPVPPLRVFDVVRFRRQDQPVPRPFRAFELRSADGDRFRYPHRRLMHLAGMMRHLAIEAMKKDPPRDIDDDWVERYVAGHRAAGGQTDETSNDTAWKHGQLSYVPLPSVGHAHADPGVRRIMVVAPLGDEAWLAHIARRLAGQILKPENGNEFAGRQPPLLVPLRRDNVIDNYTKPANVWHSFTPVILPGHDDHKPEKTRSLLERALRQSSVDQPCEFEWSAFSRYAKSFSAHKYGQNKEPQGYFRPSYLLSQTAVHLTLKFKDDIEVPGPLLIGAGRHCGFGLMCRY